MSSTTREGYCKRCPVPEGVMKEQIERMISVIRMKTFDCASDEIYEQRLTGCLTCSSLLDNHTCRHCGCIVQIRALLKDRECPYPGGSKW